MDNKKIDTLCHLDSQVGIFKQMSSYDHIMCACRKRH